MSASQSASGSAPAQAPAPAPTASGPAPSNATNNAGSSSSAGDLRRIKSGLSCAECRRSKLKCDRSFPCQSCVRRGCAAICPDGTLTATKGNKVLMAHAERLTQQVKSMSSRIKELEAALANTQNGSQMHPLLRDAGSRDDMAVLGELESTFAAEMDEVSDTIGSLSISQDGKTRYHGETTSSEYLQSLMDESEHPVRHLSNPKFLGLPSEVLDLVNAFPFGLREHRATVASFKAFIPPRARTQLVSEQFYTNASWLYDPIPRDEFHNMVVDPLYNALEGYIPFDSISAHHLSIFFMVLATGLIFSPGQSAPILQEQYHALGCAAFSMDSITRGASTATVQAMILLIHYSYWTDRTGHELRFLLNGLCVRIAQMIGLQRDSAGWNLEKEEVQRRRMSFWEFYNWDAWSSVITGRPPVLNLAQADCRFPEDMEPVMNSQGQLEPGWHKWKFLYAATCLAPSLQRTFLIRQLPYSTLLELDKRIRTFPLPEHLRPGQENGQGWSSDPFKAMSQHCATLLRESNLLYIHRSYFAQAIRGANDPFKHKYGQSVLAAYKAVRNLVSSLKGVYSVHPAIVSRCWFFWSAIFSSCVILGAVVIESPACKLAEPAMTDLDGTIAFFELGSVNCRGPATLPMLRTFQKRAREALHEARLQIQAGQIVTTPPKDRSAQDSPDELEILGGRKNVINQTGTSLRPTSRTRPTIETAYNAGSLHPPVQESGYHSSPSPPAMSTTSSSSGGAAPYYPGAQTGEISLQPPQYNTSNMNWDISPVNNAVSHANMLPTPPYGQNVMQLVDDPMSMNGLDPSAGGMYGAVAGGYADYSLGLGYVAAPPHQQQQQSYPGIQQQQQSQQQQSQQQQQQHMAYGQGSMPQQGIPMQGMPGPNSGYDHDGIWRDFVQGLGLRPE
ncbi:hypothetical protein PENSPDRAFT_629068 [Peniophora sp. CONT]|nr:hypothetical protein PENSPDRAFT_629068 [Peniophora sp. CONT]